MKTISTLALLILFTFNGFSQKGSFEIIPYGGISIPLGEYRNTGTGEVDNHYFLDLNGRGATNGHTWGITLRKHLTNKVSIQLSYNQSTHNYETYKKENLYKESFIQFHNMRPNETLGNKLVDYSIKKRGPTVFKQTFFGVNYIFFNKKKVLILSGLAIGYRHYSTTEEKKTLTIDEHYKQGSEQIIERGQIERTSFFTYKNSFVSNLTFEIIYNLSNQFGLIFSNTLFYIPQAKLEYNKDQFIIQNYNLQTTRVFSNTFYTNINLGISYNFGGKKTD